MHLAFLYRATAAAACFAALAPVTARADATARAYLADERVPGQVQPPYVHGAVSATSRVGATTDAGYAYAFADLDTGTLRVAGRSVYAPPYTTTTDGSAGVNDTLIFTGASGATAFLDYSFDGTLGVVADAIPKSAFAQLVVNIGTAGGSAAAYETLSAYPANCGFGTNCVVGTSTSRTGSLAFQIYSGAPTSFAVSLSGTASVGNAFDFANTAKLYLRLPAGVTYTSSSGSFLASAVPLAAVPEPGTYPLFLAGFTVLGWVARKRRTALRPPARDAIAASA